MERVQKGFLEPKDSDLRKLYKNLLNNQDKNDLLQMRQGLTERLLLNSSKIKKEMYPVE